MTEEKPKRKRVRTEALRKRENAYKNRTLKAFTFKLNREKDADLIEIYENISNKMDFIRDALRRYAEENGIEIKTEDE